MGNNINHTQIISDDRIGRNTSSVILQSQYYLDTKSKDVIRKKTIEQYINVDIKILNKILGNQIHSIFNRDYIP